MTTLAIMQPTYIPWVGYFNLISKADYFVFLDNVKIEKQSWQVRNKILSNKKEQFISIPIQGSRQQLINEVQVNDATFWRKKHSKFLEHSYAKHPFGKTCLESLIPIINNNDITSLATLNIQIIQTFASKLCLEPLFFRSSELNITGERSKRLISICEQFNCDHYLSPAGSRDYIEKDGDFSRSGISVEFQQFAPPFYQQLKQSEFTPYLSIVDMVANIGWEETAELIKHV